uniref:Uncharacterized protein n=1 Tax=Fibrocapsa japonica TaxID=94617 RepID=A0A7S2V474_9STRA|mmetsp:Transcript_646/g.939  ORF Transcript_646/g.939 Transcript_646/m.939 type:complete len:115 (+) Transcript_646:101-445(+)
MDSAYSNVLGGKLNLKGKGLKSKKKKGKKKRQKDFLIEKSEVQRQEEKREPQDETFGMTKAQKEQLERAKALDKQKAENVAGKSYRARIEELNEALAMIPEHNDIPRVSAAGNG